MYVCTCIRGSIGDTFFFHLCDSNRLRYNRYGRFFLRITKKRFLIESCRSCYTRRSANVSNFVDNRSKYGTSYGSWFAAVYFGYR